MDKPNVVFIMADQMIWSALGMYSDAGVETPSLERLAAEGVRFEHAITPHPLCVPARTSIMTARYPHATGCRRNETLMPEGELHAFRIWKELGFTTALIGKNHCFIEESDLKLLNVRCEISHRGLPKGNYLGEVAGNKGMEWVVPEDVINECHRTRIDMPVQGPKTSYAVTNHPIEGYSTNVIATQVEEFLDLVATGHTFGEESTQGDASNGPRPFALWVSFPDPHTPLEVPEKYLNMVPEKAVTLPPTRVGEFTDGTAPERNRVVNRILSQEDDEADLKTALRIYHAMTRFVDDGVGRILDKLEVLGLRQNTIVVFTSDHGDFAGEHRMMGKGGVFYDSLVRVPLIVSWPGGGVPQGQVDASMANTIDIVPTLLQLQGIADFTSPPPAVPDGQIPYPGPLVPPELQSDLLNSESLRRFQGMPLPTVTDASPRHAAFSEYGTGGPPVTLDTLQTCPEPHGLRTIMDTLWGREAEGRRKMVRTRRWKFVTDPYARWQPGSGTFREPDVTGSADDDDELYDLESDPWELTNLAKQAEYTGVISEMRALLLAWMVNTEDYNPVPLPRTISRA